MDAMKNDPHILQCAPSFAVALQVQQDLRETCTYIATEAGGKEEKTSKFRDIETSIQSNMRNKHDKFHNVYTNVYTRLFRLVHKLSSRSHILLL